MTTAQPLQGKVAFVQGGSRGIGAAIVKRLANEGAAVAFTYAASADRAEAVASAVTAAGGKALAIKADSADAAALQQAVRQAVSHFGNLDILVNNAGVFTLGSTEALALDDLDRMLAVNVRSVFVASQEAARHMNDGGRIIHIGSTNAE
ncbi:SDR family NAD(P)-dependent oxidoreductase, partial [Serratia marcescens]